MSEMVKIYHSEIKLPHGKGDKDLLLSEWKSEVSVKALVDHWDAGRLVRRHLGRLTVLKVRWNC